MHFKTLVLCLVSCVFCLPFSGCDMTSYQRVAMLENALLRAENVSNDLGVRLDEMEAVLVETQAALNDPNLPAEFREQLNSLLTQTVDGIKVVAAKRGEYAGLITRLREQIDQAKKEGMGLGDELTLYGEGLTETAKHLPPSVAGYVTLASILFGAIGTVLARKRKAQLTNVVGSVDKLLESGAVADIEAGVKVLKDNQLPATRNAVRKILGK